MSSYELDNYISEKLDKAIAEGPAAVSRWMSEVQEIFGFDWYQFPDDCTERWDQLRMYLLKAKKPN